MGIITGYRKLGHSSPWSHAVRWVTNTPLVYRDETVSDNRYASLAILFLTLAALKNANHFWAA